LLHSLSGISNDKLISKWFATRGKKARTMQHLQIYKHLVFDVSDQLRIGKTCLLMAEKATDFLTEDKPLAGNDFLIFGAMGLWNEALRRLMNAYDRNKKSNSLYTLVRQATEYLENASDRELLRLTLDEWRVRETKHMAASKCLLRFRNNGFAHMDQKHLVKQLHEWAPNEIVTEDIKVLFSDGSNLTRGISEAFFKESKEARIGTEYQGWHFGVESVMDSLVRIQEIDRLERQRK